MPPNYKLATFLIISYFFTLGVTVRSRYEWCVPNTTYKVDCNRCWCLPEKVPICSKMDCKQIPKEQWSKVLVYSPKKRTFFIKTLIMTGGLVSNMVNLVICGTLNVVKAMRQFVCGIVCDDYLIE